MYYKITNKTETHHGFVYKDGLNVDTLEFQPEGSCVAGGLYFTDFENLKDFTSFGIFVREVTLPDSDPDFKMVKDPEGNKYRANKIILGKKYTIPEFVNEFWESTKDRVWMLVWASIYGHLETVKFLVNAAGAEDDALKLLWSLGNC